MTQLLCDFHLVQNSLYSVTKSLHIECFRESHLDTTEELSVHYVLLCSLCTKLFLWCYAMLFI